MKTILVPVDFSNCSQNAVKYAVELALETKARIVLLHVYQIAYPPLGVEISQIPIDEQKDEILDQLKNIVETEKKLHLNSLLEITYEFCIGNIIGEILDYANKIEAGLIVMGTHGASGVFEEYVFGSNTGSIVDEAKCPVLSVPEKAEYTGFKSIVFASDFREIKDRSTFDTLMEIAYLFGSKVLVFSVRKNQSEIAVVNKVFEKLDFDKIIKWVPHSFHAVVADDTAEAIEKFATDKKADLLATIPQKHGFIDSILNKSVTRNLVYHSNIPLLSLPENVEQV